MKIIKVIVFIFLLVPIFILVYFGFNDNLTADPVEYILHYTGLWSIRMLMLTLAMTPLKNITKQFVFLRLRRMIGLYVFFYVSLHLLVYIWLDLGFEFSHLWKDILERPYITVGFLAWLLLIPLAVTSNKNMIRKLGKKWKALHKSVYVITILACLHFIWLVKNDLLEPLIYATFAFVLLFYRLIRFYRS